MERMIRVQSSLRIAARWRARTRVMDQGPVYTLATLKLHRPRSVEDARFEIWWDRMARQWARLLDAVIYLDASDAALLQRIRARSKHHRVKDGPEQQGLEWIASLRAELERTVECLREGSPLRVLRVDTGDRDPAAVVDRVCEILTCESDATDSRAAPRAATAAHR
jgi:thymidylate kinase